MVYIKCLKKKWKCVRMFDDEATHALYLWFGIILKWCLLVFRYVTKFILFLKFVTSIVNQPFDGETLLKFVKIQIP